MGTKIASFRIGDITPVPVTDPNTIIEDDGLLKAFSIAIQKDMMKKPSYTECWVLNNDSPLERLSSYQTRSGTVVVGISMDGEADYILSPFEYGYPDQLNDIIVDSLNEVCDRYREGGGRLDRDSMMGSIRSTLTDHLSELYETLQDSNPESIIDDLCHIIYRYSVGMGIFEVLLTDPHIEDIYVDGSTKKSRIYVTLNGVKGINSHLRCRTNLMIEPKEICNLVNILKRESGLRFCHSNPVLESDISEYDARATVIGYPMSPQGNAVAIRKHSNKPWTLSRLVYNGTIDPKAAGILSFLVDNRSTFLIAGARGSGKTSLLSAMMYEMDARMLVIEDTPELGCEHMRGLGYKVQSILIDDRMGGDEQSRADEALRVSLRMGDSSIILGEVRGEEAKTLYKSMRVGRAGNSVMGTIHGDSAESVYQRVVSDMGVQPDSFLATDVIITLGTVKDRRTDRMIRRVNEIVCTDKEPGKFIDISSIDKLMESPLMARVLRTSQLGRREISKEITTRAMMRSLLAEAGRIDDRYLGPEWVLISNEILKKCDRGLSAEKITEILRQRIGLKELN